MIISDTGNKADRLGLVVIGTRMVGHRLCVELVACVGHQQYRIHVLCQKPRLAYGRVGRSPYFFGTSIDDLMLGRIKPVVQDSTGFAIRIKERYRGIRARHKIKVAGSDYMREYAEAQSKNFGLVATEKGWNLYVAGNSGAKRQHEVLLAADLDEDACIKDLDRFLMYHTSATDKRTRTSTWFNPLASGIDDLRRVIINDHLSICDQLEADMAHLIDHPWEWKVIVEDPERRKPFRHVVNSNDGDDNRAWVHERRQKRSANWDPAKREEVLV